MKLYHGTSPDALESILKDGLVPRFKTPGNWSKKDQNPSMPGCVYLTDSYAGYFAMATDGLASGKGLVIEIDTDKLLGFPFMCLPDEDFLREANDRQADKIRLPGHKNVAGWMTLLFNNKHMWQDSLKHLGTCSFMGKIPVEAITRYALFQRNVYWISRFDNSVGILPYLIMQNTHRQSIKLMFDGEYPLTSMDKQRIKADVVEPSAYWFSSEEALVSMHVNMRNETVKVVDLKEVGNDLPLDRCVP